MNLAHGWSILDPLAAWIATYCLHSTVLLGVAWLVARGRASPAVQEGIWRIAVSAGLLTSGLQQLWGSGRWIWPVAPPVDTPEVGGPVHDAFVGMSTSTLTQAADSTVGSPSWTAWCLAAFAVVAGFGLARLVGAAWRLRQGLRARVELTSGPLRRELDDLLEASGEAPRALRLTLASSLDVPVALGVFRPEIAVPCWAVEALDRDEQRSLLAHELAHLVRGDTVWRPAAALIAALLPFQPLNRLAASRLEHLSEDLADDWARRRSAGVALARCLTHAGDHLLGGRSLPIAAMASPNSDLGRRVRRLLAPARTSGRSLPASALAIAVALVVLPMATLAPGWATVPEAPPTPPAPPAPEVAPQAPAAPSTPEPENAPEPASAPEPRVVPESPPAPDVPPAPSAPEPPRWPDRLDRAPRPIAPTVPRFGVPVVVPSPPAAPRFPTPLAAPAARAVPRFVEPVVAPTAPGTSRPGEPKIAPAAPAAPVPTVEPEPSATPGVPRAPAPTAAPWVPRAPGVPAVLVPWIEASEPDDC